MLAHSCLTEGALPASILVMQESVVLKVLAHGSHPEVGNLAAGRRQLVQAADTAAVGSLAVAVDSPIVVDSLVAAVEDILVAAVGGSLVAGHMAVVEDNRQVVRHTAAGHEADVGHMEHVVEEEHHSPEAGPGRMEVAGDS